VRLRDLFRRRTDTPDLPAPAAVRRPAWPAMPPVQRAVSSPDLITAPDRFADSLVSRRNPSRGGTLGHYLTPDAPPGMSTGLAAVSPRGELPSPARPWWWPRSPAVQRRIPTSDLAHAPQIRRSATSPPVPELHSSAVQARPNSSAVEFGRLGANDPAPAPPPVVPVYPLAGHALVSAAGAEPPRPRLALPAVQRAPDSPAPIPVPSIATNDLLASESPLEIEPPSVVEPWSGPALEASAGSSLASSPGSRSDLPIARRFGLGTPLQRVPDAAGTVVIPPAAAAPFPPTAAGSPRTGPNPSPKSSTPPPRPSLPAQRAVGVPPQPGSPTVWQPSPGPTGQRMPAAVPTGSVTVQRRLNVDAKPTDAKPTDAKPTDVVAPISDTPPIASMAVSPMPSGAVAIHSAATPSVATPSAATPSPPLAAGSRTTGPSPSSEQPMQPAESNLPVQRAVDIPPQPYSSPASQPSASPPAATYHAIPAAPMEGAPGTVQRHVDAEPLDIAPRVSDSPPVASVAVSLLSSSTAAKLSAHLGAAPPTVGPRPSLMPPTRSVEPGLAVQRSVDTTPQRESPDMPTPPIVAQLQTQDPPPSNHLPDPAVTTHSDSVAPAVVGLIGDRPIEPVTPDYAAAVDSAALPVAAPVSERTRRPTVQRRTASAVPGVAVARSTGGATTPAGSWPLGVLPVSRSLPGITWPAPAPPAPPTATKPIAVQTAPSELRTELVVQRADDTAEPAAAATSATAATDHAAATTQATSAGSTSPTDVDTLVRRLYDPIVRRLKAELQLDRERAGHSLDLRH
jgi:hypothetical protein